MSSTVASNTTSKENRNSASDRRFQQALFTYHRGDYSIALREFEKSAEMARLAEDHSRFVESCTYILRILAERDEFGKA